jgi:hypothetical protein
MNKKALSERDICTKYITPALKQAGWDEFSQIREEVYFTKGRIIVRGRLVTRGKAKRADYILYYKPNIPLAIIEAKDNNHSIGDGIQQALGSAATRSSLSSSATARGYFRRRWAKFSAWRRACQSQISSRLLTGARVKGSVC